MNPEKADLGDWEWQINCYRYMLEKQGKEINNMYVQVTVRDGGIQAARDRGVEHKIYLIDVPYIHNDHIEEKFSTKRDALLESIKLNKLPEMCSEEETWGGKKCKSYCDARDICPYVKNKFKEHIYQIDFIGKLPENIEEHVTIVEELENSIKVQLIDVGHANKFLNYLLTQKTLITGFNEILPTLNEIFIKTVGGTSDE